MPVSRSKAEIEHIITRYGATRFASYTDERRAAIMFEARERRVRFTLPLPVRDEYPSQAAYEREQRRIWRALALVIKAKLESIESGIETFKEAFMPQLVLADNTTVGERVIPLVAESYRLNSLQPLLPIRGILSLPPGEE